MPNFLDSGDRRLVIGAVGIMVLLMVLAYAFRPAPAQQAIGSPSSYSPDWLGTKAAFLLLQQSGYRIERWISPPEELPEEVAGTTLIFAEPSEKPSSGDSAAVARFVSAGGRLLVMGASGAGFAPQSSSIAIPDSNLTAKVYPALLPSPLSRDAPEVTMVAPDKWTPLAPGQLAIYGKESEPVVVWYRFGKGQVIWWAISSPMSNGSLREKGNLAMFLNSVGPPVSRVLWDEYFHGMRRSLLSYIVKTPLPWGGLQIAIALAAVLFTFSRRLGPVRMPVAESRLSPLEFVNTLGELYESAHAASGAVAASYQRLRLSLSRKLAIAPSAKLSEFSRMASTQLGWPEQALVETLFQSERAMRKIDLDDAEALYLVGVLHDYSERLERV
jgi:hypothetical protein